MNVDTAAIRRGRTRVSRPDWDSYGLLLAEAVAQRADCTRRKVGAVIFDRDNRVVSTGYNGSPAGQPGCLAGACPRGRLTLADLPPGSSYDAGPGTCIALHAEQNCIMRADWERMRGGTIYVTSEPCAGCTRTLSGTPLARVVWPR